MSWRGKFQVLRKSKFFKRVIKCSFYIKLKEYPRCSSSPLSCSLLPPKALKASPEYPDSSCYTQSVTKFRWSCTRARIFFYGWSFLTTSKVTSELRWCLNSIALPSGNIVTDRLKMSNVLWERQVSRLRPNNGVVRCICTTSSFRHS